MAKIISTIKYKFEFLFISFYNKQTVWWKVVFEKVLRRKRHSCIILISHYWTTIM